MEEGDEGGQEGQDRGALIEASEAAEPNDRLRLIGWGIGALLVALLRNRLWASPNLSFFTAISSTLGRNPFGGALSGDYLLTNLPGPVLARVLGQTEPHEYVRLHLAVLVLGCAAVVAAMYRRFGYRPARLLCVLLAAAPASTVAMEWLGQPDAFTFPLALGVVVAAKRRTALVLAILLGLSHAEQGVGIALIAAVVRVALSATLPNTAVAESDAPILSIATLRSAATELAPLLGGVAVGRLIVEVYLRVNDMTVNRPRTDYLDMGVSGFIEHHAKSDGLIIYALWGPLWLGLLWVAWRTLRPSADSPAWPSALRRAWLTLGLAATAAVLPMLITLDETRVYSLIAAPLLVGAAVLGVRSREQLMPARLAGLTHQARLGALAVGAVVLALVPGLFTAGEAYNALDLPPREFARFLVDGTHRGDLTSWLLGPFGFEVPTAK